MPYRKHILFDSLKNRALGKELPMPPIDIVAMPIYEKLKLMEPLWECLSTQSGQAME